MKLQTRQEISAMIISENAWHGLRMTTGQIKNEKNIWLI